MMQDDFRRLQWLRVAGVGIVSILVALVITGSIGRLYATYQILNLLRGMSAALQFLGSAVFTALAAILGLTVTSVSLLRGLRTERLTPNFLHLVRTSAVLCIAGMGLSLLLMLITIVPAAQDQASSSMQYWLYTLYYLVVALVSVLVGVVMMLMFLLFDTIHAVLDSLPQELIRQIEAPVEVVVVEQEAETETEAEDKDETEGEAQTVTEVEFWEDIAELASQPNQRPTDHTSGKHAA